jgi:hypothetical protein
MEFSHAHKVSFIRRDCRYNNLNMEWLEGHCWGDAEVSWATLHYTYTLGGIVKADRVW